MNNSKISQAVKLAILTAGATTLVAPAVAQEQIEEITVTGSRIVRSDLESVSPLSIISNEEFVISGNLNVEQKLAELPLTLPSFGPSSNNPGDGTARVDLRGLGTSRTLVLVNGRRYIPATQFGVVDLNSIPGTLIKQVDVVTGGASAVYGSDALAGVVNFQMIDDFEGVQITGLYDITSEGDAEKYNFDLTIGGNFADGRGNATVYASYSRRHPLFQGDRDFTTFALGDDNPVGTPGQNSNTGVGGPLAASGSSGVPGTRTFTGPTVDPDGVAGSGDEYTLGTWASDGTGLPWVEPDSRFNYAPDNYLQLPQRRYLMSAFAHFDITETVTAYTELTYSANRVPQELAPTPAFTTVTVNPDSPFFAPSVQDALAGTRTDSNGDGVIDDNDNAAPFFVGRRMVENGSRQAINNRNAYRILVGARGDINDEWGWDASWMRSDLTEDNLLNNDVSASRFIQAVLVTDDGQSCQNPTGGCVPINIFGPGNISPAAIDYVNIGAANVTTIETEIITGAITGEFGGIGDAGPIGLAVGFERRDDVSAFRPDEFLSSGDVLGFNAGEQTVGAYNATEFFGEINIPLLEGVTGAESLSFWAAARASDYSNVGNVTSFATALNWAPIESLRFRGGYQQAVRAPNVGELFQGSANGFPGATDPCSDSGSAAGTAPGNTVYDLCLASGVVNPGGFTQPNIQIEGIFGGNPDLEEETGDTYTLGLVWQPTDGLDITLDYFDITIEDTIDVLGGGVNGTLDICYNVIQDLASEECQAVTRFGSQGAVDFVSVLNSNIGQRETSGFDVTINWVTDFDAGFFGEGSTLAIDYRSTFVQEWNETPVVGLDNISDCEGTFGDVCRSEPMPEQLHNTRITWLNGPLTVSMLWRYIDSVDSDVIKNNDVDPSTLSVPVIDAANYVDLSFAYQFTDSFRMNLGFKNIFDELPTFVGDEQEQGNTFPSTYSMFGPRVFLSGSYHWQ